MVAECLMHCTAEHEVGVKVHGHGSCFFLMEKDKEKGVCVQSVVIC